MCMLARKHATPRHAMHAPHAPATHLQASHVPVQHRQLAHPLASRQHACGGVDGRRVGVGRLRWQRPVFRSWTALQALPRQHASHSARQHSVTQQGTTIPCIKPFLPRQLSAPVPRYS